MNQTLKSTIQDTADVAGKGAQFQSAMKEYRNAMRLKGFGEQAIEMAWKAALTGIGAGAGTYAVKKALEK